MDALCPLAESSTDTAHDRLTLGAILRAFLPALLHLLKLGNHKVRVLWHLAACGTPALGANLFACPPLSASTLGTALLRKPALPALPGCQKLAMARKTDTQSLTDPLLPLRLHSASRT
jgi:hypothetical protein